MSVVKTVAVGLLALAFLGPALLLICAVAVGAVAHAGRAALARLRIADDDQAVGDAPPIPGPVPVEAPTAGGRWCHPTDGVWFADRFAAIAATMPDLARIDIQRLLTLYPIPSTESTKE